MIFLLMKSYTKRKIINIGLLLFSIALVVSQLSAQPISKPRFKNLRKTDGLPGTWINKIVRDAEGFVWFATNNGLCRYDSPSQLKIYNQANTPGLPSSNIRTIYADTKGNLWIGTRLDGLVRYHQSSGQWTTFTHDPEQAYSISNNQILSILEDRQGMIWVGTENGLNIFDPSTAQFRAFKLDETDSFALQGKAILDIMEDDKGWIWISTWGGGHHLVLPGKNGDWRATKFRQFIPAEVQESLNVWDSYQDNDGRYWLGTHGSGLFLMQLPANASNDPDYQNWEPVFHNYLQQDNLQGISNNAIRDIIQDKNGRLWVATIEGLNIMRSTNLPPVEIYNKPTTSAPELVFDKYFYDYKAANTIVDDDLQCLFEDRQGLIWIGSTMGISFFDAPADQFDNYEFSDYFDRKFDANAIYIDTLNRAWITSGTDGLVIYNPQRDDITYFSKTNRALFLGETFTAIQHQNDSLLYIGNTQGVTVLDLSDYTSTKFPFPQRLKSRFNYLTINKILVDRQNKLWLGSDNGLFMVDQATGEYELFRYNSFDTTSISDEAISTILEDSNGDIWVGTYQGLNKVIKSPTGNIRFHRFQHNSEDSNSLPSNRIKDLEEIDGILYIGSTNGLFSYNLKTKQFFNFSQTDNKYFFQNIEADSEKRLWISTTEGILLFNTIDSTYRFFDQNDGLNDLTFRPVAGCVSKDGYVYFLSNNGVTRIHPEYLRKNTTPPPVFITDVKAINTKEEQLLDGRFRKEIELASNTFYLTIGFAALNYSGIEKNRYAYKLEGFDEDWNYASTNAPVTYTNLEKGQYVFKVKAANNDGVWSETATELRIFKKPAFWETNWFLFSTLFAAILFILYAFRYYSSTIRMRNQRLKSYNETLNKEIQQRIKVEHTLADRENFLRLIMNNIPQHIYWVDQDLKLIGANTSFLESVKANDQFDVQGKQLSAFYKDVNFIATQEKLARQVIEKDKPILDQINRLDSLETQEVQWISQSYIPLRDKNGKVIRVLVSSEDISTRIKTERVLKSQAQQLNDFNTELKRSNRDLEQFAYIASHDLQTPLRTIGSFAGLLSKKLEGRLSEEEEEYFGFITSGVSSMHALIIDLLAFSRVNSQERKAQQINLNNLLKGIQRDLDAVLKEERASIVYHDFPETIKADKVKLKQLFQNLITNGIKFSREGVDPIIDISCKDQADFWQFEVKDNGIGIDKDGSEKIFQLFRRLHSSDEYEGTGIGLAICKKIVEQHNGEIWVESEVGAGSNFIFTISKSLN